MEADLRREYGVRLRDLHTGDLTYRELSSYVRGFSPGSATRTAVNGFQEPTPEAVLLADMWDAVTRLDYHFLMANRGENARAPKEPKPWPRWWPTTKAKTPSPQRAARRAEALRRKRDRQRMIAQGKIG